MRRSQATDGKHSHRSKALGRVATALFLTAVAFVPASAAKGETLGTEGNPEYSMNGECRRNGVYEAYELPPVHIEAFRYCLLELLQKLNPQLGQQDGVRDITEERMNPSFGPFCNVDAERRRHFVGFETARLSPEAYETLRTEMIDTCSIRVFAQRDLDGYAYVVVYGYTESQRPSPEDSEYFASSRNGDRMIVLQTRLESDDISFSEKAARLAYKAYSSSLKKRD